jgi:hypothetical protein
VTAHCQTCQCGLGEDIPQPGRSNDHHRRAVIAGAKQVIDSKRRDRMTALPAAAHPTRDDDTRQGGER